MQEERSCLGGTTRVTRSPVGCQGASVCCGPSHDLFPPPVTQTRVIPFWWLSTCRGRCCPPWHSSTCVCAAQKGGAQCKVGLLGPWAAGALNPELWGWKSLNEDWESVGCVASHVAETGRGWFLNLSSCNQEPPSKSFPAFTINICKSYGEEVAYS